MIQKGNLVIADKGKYLQTPYGILQEVELGEFPSIVNGKEIIKNYKLQDIYEVTPIRIQNNIYYVQDTSNYSKLVSELIRIKYSLDDELALIANARLGNLEGEEDFQNWRTLCKTAAKSYMNE